MYLLIAGLHPPTLLRWCAFAPTNACIRVWWCPYATRVWWCPYATRVMSDESANGGGSGCGCLKPVEHPAAMRMVVVASNATLVVACYIRMA